eukprot:7384874-Prymnesium_polylepis.3
MIRDGFPKVLDRVASSHRLAADSRRIRTFTLTIRTSSQGFGYNTLHGSPVRIREPRPLRHPFGETKVQSRRADARWAWGRGRVRLRLRV